MSDEQNTIQVRLQEAFILAEPGTEDGYTRHTRLSVDLRDPRTNFEFRFSVLDTLRGSDSIVTFALSPEQIQLLERFTRGLRANALLDRTQCVELEQGTPDEDLNPLGLVRGEAGKTRFYDVEDMFQISFPLERPGIAVFSQDIPGNPGGIRECFVMPYQDVRIKRRDDFIVAKSNWKTMEVLNLPAPEELVARKRSEGPRSRPRGRSPSIS